MKKHTLVIFAIISVNILGLYCQDLPDHYLSFKPGTIVKTLDNKCVFNYSYLAATNKPYDIEMIGVIRDSLSYSDPRFFPNPIIEKGVAWVRCNTTNGIIKTGDPVTSSSVPGEAMKATQSGMILGVALEDAPANSELIKIRIMIQYLKQ